MNIREDLIRDIELFIPKANDLYNNSRYNITPEVNKSDFFSLESRFYSLTEDNFESEEKYNYYSKYINQARIQDESHKFKHILQQDNIKGEHFNYLCNHLIRFADRLK